MLERTINFTGVFEHYTPIDMQPYYVFTTEHRYLVKCENHPELIGELCSGTKVNIQADIGSKLSQGTQLLNVKWEMLDEPSTKSKEDLIGRSHD